MSESRETKSGASARRPSQEPGGLLRWLTDPKQRRFILPATGLWILALDWLLFSSNMLSAWLATPVVMLSGFALGGTGAFVLQKRHANDSSWIAGMKALLAGIVVGLPWPIGGTLVGGWVLLTSGLADARREILGRSRRDP